MDDVYEKLRQYMDEINPFGCPKTEDGAHLEFLKALFAPEEAEIFLQLRMHPEPVGIIAERLGKGPDETAGKLEGMFKKGTVLKRRENDVTRYGASIIGPGILEAIVAIEDDDVLIKMGKYFSQGVGAAVVRNKTGLLRTLPIEMEIPAESKAQTYEKISELIHNFPKPIAAIDCGCRKMAKKAGAGCDAPLQNCLVFGDHALFHIENNHGKELDVPQALQILKEAEEAGLVHNAINFTDWEGASYLCNCCSCCCSTLSSINKLYPEGEVCGISRSNYVAEIDFEKCSGCEICVEHCNINAMSMKDDHALVDDVRCLGCGLCVKNCPEEAIRLFRRPADQTLKYPKSMEDLYHKVRTEVRQLEK